MKQVLKTISSYFRGNQKDTSLSEFQSNGFLPWTAGYDTYKWISISEAISSSDMLNIFQQKQELPARFGWRVDERIVEYPWLFAQIEPENKRVLDAGSALNFLPIIQQMQELKRDITIMTLAPEDKAYWHKKISYHYGDLRQLPFKDAWFDEIISISTIEHIGFDNTIYGANMERKEGDHLQVVDELWRVLAVNGTLYLTVPYGQADDIIINDEIFARQFDASTLNYLLENLETDDIDIVFYRYTKDGWIFSNQSDCDGLHYFNIHQQDYAEDIAAAARAVCCIKAVKSIQ